MAPHGWSVRAARSLRSAHQPRKLIAGFNQTFRGRDQTLPRFSLWGLMYSRQQTYPATEQVSRTEAKLWCRIAAGNTSEDSIMDMLIESARTYFENATNLVLASRDYIAYLDAFPAQLFPGVEF